ncbi:MAG: hypothetical protein QXI11_02005 [Thermoproteota archaeon]
MTTYIVEVEIPAATPASKPVFKEIEIEEDAITQIIVYIPPGVRGSAMTRLMYGEYQVFPRPRGQWISGDAAQFTYREVLILPSKRSKLRVEGISPNATYPHTITWHITALPKEIAHLALALSPLEKFISVLGAIFGVREVWMK